VIESCRLPAQIADEFERTRPFDGIRIGTGIHLEPKTVALLLTLARGGAEVISTGNLNTTQQEALVPPSIDAAVASAYVGLAS
jgi:adenosylhomocysteinase